jgi:hypothetical protein
MTTFLQNLVFSKLVIYSKLIHYLAIPFARERMYQTASEMRSVPQRLKP